MSWDESAPAAASVLLASDVDGTFWSEGLPLAALRRAYADRPPQVEVLFASSRTALELDHLARTLGAGGDFIAENGAVAVTADEEVAWHLPGARRARVGRGHAYVAVWGDECATVRRAVEAARARHAAPVRLMEELEPSVLARLIGDEADVRRAAVRRASVLVHAAGAGAALAAWVAELRRSGHQVLSGGRWLAVWRGPGKGHALRRYLRARALAGKAPAIVAAIGDGENDASLLQSVEFRYAVPRPDGTVHPALRALAGVAIAPESGTGGWRSVVSTLGGLSCHS
jgi:predicted mannosyl-3-phosphoglycerate phosphatase (HAD superfamily)